MMKLGAGPWDVPGVGQRREVGCAGALPVAWALVRREFAGASRRGCQAGCVAGAPGGMLIGRRDRGLTVP